MLQQKVMGEHPLFDVFLSDCTLENEPDLLRSTIKVGTIARILSIYRVSRVVVYRGRPDDRCKTLGERLKLLLEYAVTPPYLKRKLFPLRSELKYVGLMPPLQISTHDVSEVPHEGEVRMGLVESVKGGKVRLFVGLKDDIWVKPPSGVRLEKGEVIPLIFKGGRWRILRKDNEFYLGYEVVYEKNKNITDIIKSYEGLRIGTSRLGDALWQNVESIIKALRTSKRVAVFFGDPYMGLEDILPAMGMPDFRKAFDFFLNFIPNQGTKSVRVEEALAAVLQSIVLLLSMK